jgi:hypothetical protein
MRHPVCLKISLYVRLYSIEQQLPDLCYDRGAIYERETGVEPAIFIARHSAWETEKGSFLPCTLHLTLTISSFKGNIENRQGVC